MEFVIFIHENHGCDGRNGLIKYLNVTKLSTDAKYF